MAVHQTRGGIARAEFDFALGVQLRAVRAAVVSHGVRLSDDLDLLILVLAVAAPGDLQAAIHARDGLVLVVHHSASLVGDGHIGDDVVVVRAVRNVRYAALHRRRHLVAGRQGCEFARRHGVVHAVIVHGVAAVGMRLAVILPGVAVRGDLDFGFVLPDLQRAGHVGDNIVPGYVVVIFVNDDRGLRHKLILVHANHGLAAVDGNRLHLVAGREVFRRVADVYLDLTRGVQLRAVRLAVVDNGIIRRRQNNLHVARAALGNRQRAGYVGDIVVRGYFDAVSVHDDRFAGNQLIRVYARVRFAAFDGKRLHAVTLRQIRNHEARADLDLARRVQLRAVRLAVVDNGVVRRRQNNLVVARAAPGDRQRAGYVGDGLILTLRVLASGVYDGQPVDGVVVLRAVADVGHRLGDLRLHNVAGRQRRGLARFHFVRLAVVFHGVSAVGMRLAVVLPAFAVRGDGDGLLVLSDLQLARIIRDIIVLLIELFATSEGDRVGHFAFVHEGHAASGLDIGHLARHKAVAAHGDNRLRQRRAVVCLARRLGGQRHGALVDDQLAVGHDELDVREVLAVVPEVAFLQTHRIGIRVGSLHLGGAGEGEVLFLIKLVADSYNLIVLRAVFRTVVRKGFLITLDRHDHFGLHGRNRQLAGGLGDGVVLGNVHVVLIKNLHRAGERAYVLALIRALGCVGQVFIPVTGLQTINRDAGDGLLAAIVHLRIAFAREGHGEARVGDGQLAGGLGNVVVLRYVVALSVLNHHVAAERAVVAANILAFRLIGQAFVSVTLHKAALRDAGNALHAAGVGEGLAFAGEGHGARGNGQRALHAVGEGVAAGHVGFAARDLVARYHVVAAADVRLAALDNRRQNVAVHQHALGVVESVIRQRGAVVNLFAVSSGDGNGLALAPALGDGQLAFILGDGIVALFVVRAGGVGDGVGHFALMHEGHAAGSRDIGHLAVHKAVAGHGNIRLRQRRAVVFLARRLGGQRHGALVDGQLAINAVREGVVAGYVLIAARDHIARNFVHARVAHIRGAAFDNRRQHVAFHQHALGEGEVVIRQRGSVVGLAGAFRGDGDRFFRDRVDLQNAVHDIERDVREVLIRVLEVARDDANRVFARVRALRSPRGGFGRLDALGHVVQRVVSRHGLVALRTSRWRRSR